MADTTQDDYLTPFVGRERELARIAALLDEGCPRIVIVGASGIGKARLARECGGGALVSTSGEASGSEGEVVVELDGFGVEGGRALFLERMARRAPGVVPQEGIVDALVEAVGGVALAIELLASRAGVLAPVQILEQLGPRLERAQEQPDAKGSAVCSGLAAAIDWSWSLLDDHERAALAQCSRLAGRFSAADAEDIAGPGDATPGVLAALCEKSLMRVESSDSQVAGFGLHASIRSYARERLTELE